MSKTTATLRPKVDILLPYWGEFSLLKKAVDSVLAQTEQNWKLLIVDDCYPSEEAMQYYQNINDDRIKYIRHERNIGLVKNFKFVLDRSSADYCVILGCDDILLPNYLETALAHISDVDFYQPGVEVIDNNDNVYLPMADRVKKLLRPNRPGIHSGESIATSLCHGNWIYFPSVMWKTSTLKRYGFDENRKNTQDLAAELNILKDGGLLYLDNAVTFQYRRSSFSFSSKAKNGTRFTEENEMYDYFAREFTSMGWRKAALAARLRFTVRLHKLIS